MKAVSDLAITLIQTNLFWEDPKANLTHLESLLKGTKLPTDIIVLPEMFSTGFSMNPAPLAEPYQGKCFEWMVRMAKQYDAAITGSIMTYINSYGIRTFYNRLYWVNPDGSHSYYDKRHLFSFAGEHAHYSAGSERLIVIYKGWKICPLICYDLRFPVWSRNANHAGKKSDTEFDVLIYVANWPEARRKPWTNLLEARAHENQVYVVGVNRIGEDGNGIMHSGDSSAFSPKGELITTIKPFEETVETVLLSRTNLDDFRAKFTVWKDKDDFSLSC